MDKQLSGLVCKCVLVYLDDIIVYITSAKDHEKHLKLVFDRLWQDGLRWKPTKFNFGLSEVKLLGYILNGEGIQTDPEQKVAALNNLATPTSASEVWSFLGMSGYYRQCIPEYTLSGTDMYIWTVHMEWLASTGLNNICKSLLTSSHVMAAPRSDQPYMLYTYACDYEVGIILVQVDWASDPLCVPCTIISPALTGCFREGGICCDLRNTETPPILPYLCVYSSEFYY